MGKNWTELLFKRGEGKHTWAQHKGEVNLEMFEMKLEGSFKKPLSRQIREGVELEMSGAAMILNSKSEWNHSKIPRIVVETGDELKNDKESGLGSNKEKVEKSGGETDKSEKKLKFTLRRYCAEK